MQQQLSSCIAAKENVVKKMIVQKLAKSWGKAMQLEQLDCSISEVQREINQ